MEIELKIAGVYLEYVCLAFVSASFIVEGCNKASINAPVTTPLMGTVLDSVTDTPIPFANIALGSESVSATSSGTYSFSYRQLQSGVYKVQVSAPGYQTESGQLQISADTTQTIDFKLHAFQWTITIDTTIAPNSYSVKSFSLDNFPFIQCNNGMLGHGVRVSVQIDTSSQPLNVILVAPDGSYQLQQDSPDSGLYQTFLSSTCGEWALVLNDTTSSNAVVSGRILLDFSNYPSSPVADTVGITVPLTYPAIAVDSPATFTRFMLAGTNYQLRLNIQGGSNDAIVLNISDPNSNALFNQTVAGTFISQNFAAASDGFYRFTFQNKSSAAKEVSVAGVLAITR